MALTSAQALRLKVQDAPLRADSTYYGDGTAASFALPHRNLVSASAFVPNGAAWTATGATFNPTGVVEFSGVISANSAFRTVYVHSTFSDDEIDHFISAGGSINGAAMEAVHALMFDATKRARWAAPDGTTYDDTMAMNALRDLYKVLESELAAEAFGGGQIFGWGLNQESY
jgi:hypothetical protein